MSIIDVYQKKLENLHRLVEQYESLPESLRLLFLEVLEERGAPTGNVSALRAPSMQVRARETRQKTTAQKKQRQRRRIDYGVPRGTMKTIRESIMDYVGTIGSRHFTTRELALRLPNIRSGSITSELARMCDANLLSRELQPDGHNLYRLVQTSTSASVADNT